MRKNVKKQLALRVLSTAALVAMVSSIATAAFADTYDLNKGSVDILAEGGKQYITQWEDKDNDTCVKDGEGKEIRDREDSKITLTTKDETTGETETTSNTVTIDAKEDNTANVTLENVHIEVDTSKAKSGAIEIKGDGNTKLELNGDNTVLVTNQWFKDEHAAIEKADTYGKEGTLTIKDDVNDDGSEKTGTKADTTGTLLAGGFHGTAAIGGGNGDRYSGEDSLADTSNITITGGKITAIAGNDGGAGIGGGYNGTGKNIRIEGNADVTAVSSAGAAIGGGTGSGNSVTITDDAVVDAYSTFAAAIGNGDQVGRPNDPTTITISGNATVHAETSQRGCAIGTSGDGSLSDLTINIEKNANVTAIASHDRPAIGNAGCHGDTTTTINITGGTVNAINSYGSDNPSYPNDGTGNTSPAIGGTIHDWDVDDDHTATCNVNINSSTGDTIVNAYIYGKGSGTAIGSRYKGQNVPADSASYKADGSSHFGESNSAIVNCYQNGAAPKKEKLNLPSTKDDAALNNISSYRHEITGGTLTKVVHNRKYMDENPNIDTSDLKDEDLHDWKLVGKVVEPTTEKDGYADYICSIDKCGQTKHVVLPKIVPDTPSTPETPDTPDTPNTPSTPDKPSTPSTPDVPSTPEVTPADPAVTPDASVQDAVPDTAPADAAVMPAAAQNVVQDAKPEAAATAAAALPQTGANWLAVVGSALSGLFLLAAGFVLDRKGRRMN
jgi:LPXTG-motif cell wall-anchored protein